MSCSANAASAGSLGWSAGTSGATRWYSEDGRPIQKSRPKRPRDLLPEEGPERDAGDATHEFAHEQAIGDRVITVASPRLPEGRLRRERLDDGVPCQPVDRGDERVADGVEPGLMAQQPSHRDLPFAIGGELRPVLGDRRVHVEDAAVGEQVGDDRARALRRRIDHLERIFGVRPAGLDVGDAAPEVDDPFAVDVQRERCADLPVLLEVPGERVAHTLEPRLNGSLDDGHANDCPVITTGDRRNARVISSTARVRQRRWAASRASWTRDAMPTLR